MSSEAVEVALYDLGVKREARAGFASDPDAFLARYALAPEEAAMIREFNVAGLQARSVSPLLTMGFWMMNHPGKSRGDYLDQLRTGGQ
jgi:protocatechuate 4,5-dioxygenase alpha chain